MRERHEVPGAQAERRHGLVELAAHGPRHPGDQDGRTRNAGRSNRLRLGKHHGLSVRRGHSFLFTNELPVKEVPATARTLALPFGARPPNAATPAHMGPGPARAGPGPNCAAVSARLPRAGWIARAPAPGRGRATACGGASAPRARRSRRAVAVRGGEQHAADDRRVEQHGRGEADAELFHLDHRERREDAERPDHHDGRARDHARGALDADGDGVACRRSGAVRLADAREHEHVVVHREPEQDHEEEQREPRDDRAVRADAEQRVEPVVLEDEHEQAPRGRDREQVEPDRRQRDAQAAEAREHEQQRQREHEQHHDRQARVHERVEVVRPRGVAGHVCLGDGARASRV